MKNFFNLCEYPELRKNAYGYLLSLCDRASFLYGYGTDGGFDFEFEALGSDCEEIIRDVTEKSRTQAWAMRGAEYTFALSDRVKSVILKYGLEGVIPVGSKALENLCLYRKDKCLYSVCSHEGYVSIDEEFQNKVSDYSVKKAMELPIYKELENKFFNYEESERSEFKKALTILGSISNYVRQACRAVIYCLPIYEIGYNEYAALADKYLSGEVAKILKNYKSFDELHQYGYPETFEEMNKFTNVPTFESSEIYCTIKRQLELLKLVWYNHGIAVFSETDGGCPTLVISDK